MAIKLIVTNWLSDLNGNNQNTYKFILQLCILNHAKTQDMNIIPYTTINDFFIERYWDNLNVFNLRESTDINRGPGYHGIVAKVAAQKQLTQTFFCTAEKNNPYFLKDMQAEVGRQYIALLNNPIARLQHDAGGNRAGGGDPSGQGWLYSWAKDSETLTIDPELFSEIGANYSTLKILTIYHWAKFIEKFNAIPRVIEKLENNQLREPMSRKTKNLIKDLHGGKCSYCGSAKAKNYDIDHLIPFAFIFDNSFWNLVYSCADCNRGPGGKFEKVPKETFLKMIIQRNTSNFESLKDLQREFTTSEDIEPYMTKMYKMCLHAGFGVWKNRV